MGSYDSAATLPGRFSTRDGTIDFYLRVRSFLTPESNVLDLGAGRGAWFEGDPRNIRRQVRHLAKDVRELIAVDVDEAVLTNRSSTRNLVMHDGRIPLPDACVDLVVADYVIEHVADPEGFKREVERVLKPGGMFCARTPHAGHYVSLASRLLGNSRQQRVLSAAQPHRESQDVFPTAYKLNTLRAVHRTFSGWKSWSFVFPGEPAYHFGSRLLYNLFLAVHACTPAWFHGNLFVFLQKPPREAPPHVG